MKLYHGTDKLDLNYITLNKSKKDNDFGRGFYLTTSFEQAKSWALKKGDGKGAVYEFEVDLENEKLNILTFDGKEEDCSYLYYLCRNQTDNIVNEVIPNWENIDIIFGPMIGNSRTYKENIKFFHGKNISFSSIKNKVKTIKYNTKSPISTFDDLTNTEKLWGNQYCFKSERAKELLNIGVRKVTYFEKVNNEIVKFSKTLNFNKKLSEKN